MTSCLPPFLSPALVSKVIVNAIVSRPPRHRHRPQVIDRLIREYTPFNEFRWTGLAFCYATKYAQARHVSEYHITLDHRRRERRSERKARDYALIIFTYRLIGQDGLYRFCDFFATSLFQGRAPAFRPLSRAALAWATRRGHADHIFFKPNRDTVVPAAIG